MILVSVFMQEKVMNRQYRLFQDLRIHRYIYICFNDDDLTCKRYEVNQEWMMTIAYYRGALDEYKNHPVIKKL